jgi:hypothetical protein
MVKKIDVSGLTKNMVKHWSYQAFELYLKSLPGIASDHGTFKDLIHDLINDEINDLLGDLRQSLERCKTDRAKKDILDSKLEYLKHYKTQIINDNPGPENYLGDDYMCPFEIAYGYRFEEKTRAEIIEEMLPIVNLKSFFTINQLIRGIAAREAELQCYELLECSNTVLPADTFTAMAVVMACHFLKLEIKTEIKSDKAIKTMYKGTWGNLEKNRDQFNTQKMKRDFTFKKAFNNIYKGDFHRLKNIESVSRLLSSNRSALEQFKKEITSND